MERRGFLVALIVTVGGLLGAFTVLPEDAGAATLTVGSGPGNFTTIQAAVDAASFGDTVFVYRGIYPEQVVIAKTLSLVGEDREATVIDSLGNGDAVRVTGASWVNISGFTVTTSVWGATGDGIELFAVQHSRIRDVNASHNTDSGIFLYDASYNVIENNTLRDDMDPWGAGVSLMSSHHNLIANNTATDNADGTSLESSEYNVIVGNNASTNWDYGVHLSTSNWNRIENNSWFDNWGRGLNAVDSDWNTIKHNRLVQNYEGIQLLRSSNNTVSDNLVLNTWDYGIRSYNGSRNRITNNTVSVDTWTGIEASWSSLDRIDNNTISGSYWADIDLDTSTAITVADNTMDGRGILVTTGPMLRGSVSNWNTHDIPASNLVNGRPVRYWKDVTGGVAPLDAGQVILANCTGVTVTDLSRDRVVAVVQTGFSAGNTIANVTGRDNVFGVYLAASSATTVRNASFANASQFGVYLSFSDGNKIENGSYNDSKYSGLQVERSNRNTFVAVNASRAAMAGIVLYYAAGNLVTGSTFSGNLGGGASLSWSSNNTFSLSRIENNAKDGFRLLTANNNTFVGNVIAWNGVRGVNVTGSVGNRAYHNDIVGNAQQAFDDRANVWDDGYPSGGNFWGDYAGPDSFQGPNQDIPGSDGIGDTPYVIDADSADAYPLMAPYVTRDPVPPTVAIGYPTEGQTLTATPVTVTGSASDAGGSGLYRVEARVNSGPWRAASGTASWSVAVDLSPGANVIEARAQDNAANPSLIATVNVTYVPPNTPPVAAFTVTPASGNVTTSFVVDASGSVDAEDPVSALEVRWDWEDDGMWDTTLTATKTAQHRFAAPGAYVIRLEVRDTGGLVDQTTRSVWVNNTAPIAAFTVAPPSGDVTTLFVVDASASSDIEDAAASLEVRWDWQDDGTWDTGWSATKTGQTQYSAPGTYTIRLEVRDSGGLTGQATTVVSVENTAPIASFAVFPLSGFVTTSFTMDASASTDLEDSPASLEVRWDWEDDGTWDAAWSTVKVTQHTYSSPGVYTTRLEVRDTGGLTGQATKSLVVDNTAPLASFTLTPLEGGVRTAFVVDASGSLDREDPSASLLLRWDWEDDGTWDTAWSGARAANHAYDRPGTYTIRLAVRDTAGLVGEATRQVSVANTPPTASFAVQPSQGLVGTVFRFDASDSSDLEDVSSSVEVRWDWDGDGTWDTAWSTNKTAEHAYVEAATYTVRVEARDTGTLTDTASVEIVVRPVPPPAEELPLWIVPAIAVPFAVVLAALFLRRRGRQLSAPPPKETEESGEAEETGEGGPRL